MVSSLVRRRILTGIPSGITRNWKPQQISSFATAVPPVTQDATSSKGPTAMVFLNMGGPSTTDEVGDFLSRLFVRPAIIAMTVSPVQHSHQLTSFL